MKVLTKGKQIRSIKFELKKQINAPFEEVSNIVNTLLNFGATTLPPREKGFYFYYTKLGYRHWREVYPYLRADVIVGAIQMAEGIFKSYLTTLKKYNRRLSKWERAKKERLGLLITKRTFVREGIKPFALTKKQRAVKLVFKPRLRYTKPHPPQIPKFGGNEIRLKQSMFKVDFENHTFMIKFGKGLEFIVEYHPAKYHNNYIGKWKPKEAILVREGNKDVVYLFFENVNFAFDEPKGLLALDINVKKIVGAYREDHKVKIVEFSFSNGVWEFDELVALKTKQTRNLQTKKKAKITYKWKRMRDYGNKYSHRREEVLRHVINQIVNFAREHKLAIAIEDIKHMNSRQMPKHITRLIHHFPYFQFKQMLIDKAMEKGVYVIALNPKGTSQECPVCHVKVSKTDDWHKLKCESCGKVWDRDVLAARNILVRGEKEVIKAYINKIGNVPFKYGISAVFPRRYAH